MNRRKVRVFISSPGDVYQERITAKKVIAELNKTFYKYAEIEAILWEDMPLLASSTFQDGIDTIIKQYNIDIAIFILWSRLGTPLNKTRLKNDGTPYLSGTEYEFDLMMETFKKIGSPRIMVYVKDEPLKNRLVNETDENLQAVISQHYAVKSFIKEHFYDEESGSNYAYTNFGGNISFENRFKTHLKGMILNLLGNNINLVKWHKNPYVGLKSFDYDESEIYFGREKAVNDIMTNVLSNIGENQSPSIVLLGESGSGKSSLVQAGIVPMMDYIEGYKYKLIKITPSLLGEKIYDDFIELFLSSHQFLVETPIATELKNHIKEDYNFAHLQYAIHKSNIEERPIFFFDQFEELFSDTNISDEQRILFLRFLKGLVITRKVFIIVSMRNDFYSYFHTYMDFHFIKENATLVYDMPLLGPTEYASIIKEPANLAGIEWEINSLGQSLGEEIINEAIELKSLPLIQFSLYELYKIKDKNNLISYANYKSIGGIKGAFLTYANGIYKNLSLKEIEAFNDILSKTITISNLDTETFVRKTSLLKDIEITEIHKELVKKLVDAHILISNKNSKNEPTITLVHEMLIHSWPIVEEWIKSEKYFIKESGYYEKRALQWSESKSKDVGLIKDEEQLLKAEYFNYWWNSKSISNVKNYIKASLDYKRKLGITRWSLFIIAYLIFLYLYVVDIDFTNITINKIISISSCTTLIVPLFLNLGLNITKKPTYKTAKIQFITWIIFLIISIIFDIFDRKLNPQDYIITDEIWPNYLVYGIYILATINAFQQYRLRLKWRERKFRIPITTKLFNREKYKIATTFINSLFIVLFIMSLLFGWNGLILSNRLEIATQMTDYLTTTLEDSKDELSNNFFYKLNNAKEIYLKEVFPDSVNTLSLPNKRKRELARSYLYRSMPDSALLYLNNDTSFYANILRSQILSQKGMYKEAANCLKYSIYDLYNQLPSQGMNWIDPISIFIMAGEHLKAKEYINFLERNIPEFSEHITGLYCNALYSIVDDNIDNDDIFYNYTTISIEDTLPNIPINKLLMAGIIDKNKANLINERIGSDITINENNVLPPTIMGEWMGKKKISDTQELIINITFKETYLICEVIEIGTIDQSPIENINDENFYSNIIFHFIQPYYYENNYLISTSSDLFKDSRYCCFIKFNNISDSILDADIYNTEYQFKLDVIEFKRINNFVAGGTIHNDYINNNISL